MDSVRSLRIGNDGYLLNETMGTSWVGGRKRFFLADASMKIHLAML